MKTNFAWILAPLALVMLPGCVNREAQKQAKVTSAMVTDPTKTVTVALPERTTVFNVIEITGELVTSQDLQVSSKLPGKIVSILVKDGDSVAPSQLVAVQDRTNLQSQYQQAVAQLQSAQSQLNQALTNAAVGPSRSTATLRAAEAQLRSARAQLEKALNGARSEERAQAEFSVANAKSSMETAKKELERVQKLVEEGAIERKRLETAQNAFIAAQSQYNLALQSQLILKNGARPEDIQTAREAVKQAEEQVAGAKAAKGLDPLLDQQVLSARSAVNSAQASVQIAKQNLSDAEIRAPFGGRVSGRPVEIGTVVGAGTPILRLVGSEGTYFEAQVPEASVGRLRPGQTLAVTVNDREITGTISAVSPSGTSIGRLFTVRVTLGAAASEVRPGMFARAKIQLDTKPNVLVVPVSAVLTGSGYRYVVVADGTTAKFVRVTTGEAKGSNIQVDGLDPTAQVIVRGQVGLPEGAKIRLDSDKPADSGAEPASKEL
ncbi:MAG: efflux RND transporter periplasmic adaptor subunit [Fimbriimonas sp.]